MLAFFWFVVFIYAFIFFICIAKEIGKDLIYSLREFMLDEELEPREKDPLSSEPYPDR